MRHISGHLRAAAAVLAAVLALLLTVTTGSTATASPRHPTRPTIVLVHGAWADGSSWAAVTKRLQHEGFTVDVPPNPLRGVASDAQSLKDFLATVPGPIVLVGHSYGGMVITNAATGNANVKQLVYVDAYIPRQGDSVVGLTGENPGSALAVADSSTVFNAVQLHDAKGNVIGVDLYVKPTLFPAFFAAGVSHRKAAVLAAGQRPLAANALGEPSPDVPAWKSIPSWSLIGTKDRIIPPAEQRAMSTRAGARIVEVKAPHLSMVSDPGAVTKLIEKAAAHS